MTFTLYLSILLLIGMALISFYLIVVVVRYFKERNEYLRDIRDELRLMNSKQK